MEITDDMIERGAQALFEIQRRNVISKGRGLPLWDKEFPEHKDYQRQVVREVLESVLK